jgi:hypothetical protein
VADVAPPPPVRARFPLSLPAFQRDSFRPGKVRSFLVGTMCLLLLNACGDDRPPGQRVEAFCSSIRKGEPIDAVLARHDEFDLQPGGRPPDAASRLSAMVAADKMTTLSGVLAEPSGSPEGARPVCSIYYSDRLKGGDHRVILAEFKPEWVGRF